MASLTIQTAACLKQGIAFALATIIRHTGATPRTAGSKMIVLADRQLHGTIGGGLVEARVVDACVGMLAFSQSKIMAFTLNPELRDGPAMACGGNVTVWIETFVPPVVPSLIELFAVMADQEKTGGKAVLISRIPLVSGASFTTDKCMVLPDGSVKGPLMVPGDLLDAVRDNRFSGTALKIQTRGLEEFIIEPATGCDVLYIFGAGHVGFHLAKMAHLTDFRTIVVDDRAEFANRDRFEYAHEIHVVDGFSAAFDDLSIDENSYIAILTRGHLHDQTVLEAALKTRAAYIGMIGSQRKRDQIYASLTEKGIPKQDLAQVYSPIGLDIDSETPAEIAVSIIGQIIQVRAQRH